MLRKTLPILSLIGLLLSTGAWIASYFDVRVRIAVPANGCDYGFVMGAIYVHRTYYDPYNRPYFHSGGNRGFRWGWLPSYTGFVDLVISRVTGWLKSGRFLSFQS